MDDSDAALLAILATAYAAKMRQAKRPHWLVLAFLLLVRAMRRTLVIRTYSVHHVIYAPSLRTAITTLAEGLARYVNLQMPSAPPAHPLVVAAELRHALALAVTKAHTDLTGKPLAKRIALIVQAETQNLTARLSKRAAEHPNVQGIIRATHSGNPCPICDSLAGTYYPPYPDNLFYTHPRCACSWNETR